MPLGSSQSGPTLGFHMQYEHDGIRYTHSGADIGAAAGSAVKAPVDAVVSFVGRVPSGDAAEHGGDMATMNAVSLRMSDGRTVTLMPLEDVSVTKGDAVCEGAVVGRLAARGDKSTKETHLHMGLKRGSTYYDPLSLFAKGLGGAMGGGLLVPKTDVPESAGDASAPTGEGSLLSQENAPLPSGSLGAQSAPEEKFGSISSQGAVLETSAGMTAGEEACLPAPLAALCEGVAWQLSALGEGFKEICDRLQVGCQLAVAACVTAALLLTAPIIYFIIRTIRRDSVRQEESENSLLPELNGGVNMQKLFPAPGTSFITRGRLAQRR